MNILILSDLHIDTCDKLGTFQWKEAEFIIFMEYLIEKNSIEKVILNGDIYEQLRHTFNEIKNSYPFLINYLQRENFIHIRGNHDMINSFSRDFFRIKNSAGQSVHIEHGHNADWLNGSAFGRFAGKLGFSVLKKLSGSKNLTDIYFKIVAFGEALNRIPKKYNTLKYLIYALKLLKEHDVVILAHTHKLESHHTYYLTKKKRYLNCGTCTFGRFQAIIFDTETLKYEFVNETSDSAGELLRSYRSELFFRKREKELSSTP